MSAFTLEGEALSPDTGYLQGRLSFPQGTISDNHGNIWIANCGNAGVTVYRDGNPDDHMHLHDPDMVKPFDVAIDHRGNAWVTSNESDMVFGWSHDGKPLPGSPFSGGQIDAPLGIAIDSGGNKWVANSGVIPVPCADIQSGFTGDDPGSITWLLPSGRVGHHRSFKGGGLTNPWGIAVDGGDHVFVANFGGSRLSEFCGTRTDTCPRGHRTGQPISGDDGYPWDGLDRNTCVAVDPSGNVWLANNWDEIPIQTNPGGDGMVAFIGLAEPIKTPLLGPPQQP